MNVVIERQCVKVSSTVYALEKSVGRTADYLYRVAQGTGLTRDNAEVYARIADAIGVVNIDGMTYHSAKFVVS